MFHPEFFAWLEDIPQDIDHVISVDMTVLHGITRVCHVMYEIIQEPQALKPSISGFSRQNHTQTSKVEKKKKKKNQERV